MPDTFALLGSAIYARLGTVQYTYRTDGTAVTTGTLGLYDSLAIQGLAPPYVIYQFQMGVDEYAFGNDSGQEMDYMLKAVSNRQYAEQQAFAIYDRAHVHLQDAPLSIAGFVTLRVRRRSRFQFRDSGGYWQVGGLYRVDIYT